MKFGDIVEGQTPDFDIDDWVQNKYLKRHPKLKPLFGKVIKKVKYLKKQRPGLTFGIWDRGSKKIVLFNQFVKHIEDYEQESEGRKFLDYDFSHEIGHAVHSTVDETSEYVEKVKELGLEYDDEQEAILPPYYGDQFAKRKSLWSKEAETFADLFADLVIKTNYYVGKAPKWVELIKWAAKKNGVSI